MCSLSFVISCSTYSTLTNVVSRVGLSGTSLIWIGSLVSWLSGGRGLVILVFVGFWIMLDVVKGPRLGEVIMIGSNLRGLDGFWIGSKNWDGSKGKNGPRGRNKSGGGVRVNKFLTKISTVLGNFQMEHEN